MWMAAAIAAAIWFVVFGILAAITNPRQVDPGAETLELAGTEPPAVVNLLANDWRVGPEALPATLLDLAARRHLAIDQVGDSTLVRVRDARSDQDLTTYERMVLDHVRSLASGTVDNVVPAEALTTGPNETSKGWWRRFQKAVNLDARARGLSRPRWASTVRAVLTLGAVVVGLLVALAISTLRWDTTTTDTDTAPTTTTDNDEEENPVVAAIVGGIAACIALGALVEAADRERDTPAGRDAAAQWLGLRELLATDPIFAAQPPAGVAIWDRHLAYGATLGVAHGAVRALPLGAESDTMAWSSVGGRWRTVQVRYPRFVPPGYGLHPLRVALAGLVQVVVAGAGLRWLPRLPDGVNEVVDAIDPSWNRDVIDLVTQVTVLLLAIVGTAVLLRGAWMLVAGSADLVGGRDTVEGRVLRYRVFGSDKSKRWWVAVDDGRGDKRTAWRLFTSVSFSQGSTVRAQVTTRLAHVKDIETVAAAPGDLATSADGAGSEPAPQLTGIAAILQQATTDHPRGPSPPLPDATALAEATGIPLQPDPTQSSYPMALDHGAASFEGPDGIHLQLAWTNAAPIEALRSTPRFLRHSVEGLGDEAYRLRIGGYLAAREGDDVLVVLLRLPGRSHEERDHLAEAVARAMFAGRTGIRSDATF
jgi:hypothetical protein